MAAHCTSIANAREKMIYGIIQEMKLTTSLTFVLDAADPASYDGTSQTWTDPIGANNFFRGLDGTATARDPTFAGTAGQATEATRFNFDGGDVFKEASNLSFADNWHKNNGAFTICALAYIIDGGASRRVFSTSDSAVNIVDGIQCIIGSDETISLRHSTSTTTAESNISTAALTPASWNFMAWAFDEAVPSLTLQVNATLENSVPTGSTSTDPPSGTYYIGDNADAATLPMLNGESMAAIWGWSIKQSDANLLELYNRIKAGRSPNLA